MIVDQQYQITDQKDCYQLKIQIFVQIMEDCQKLTKTFCI